MIVYEVEKNIVWEKWSRIDLGDEIHHSPFGMLRDESTALAVAALLNEAVARRAPPFQKDVRAAVVERVANHDFQPNTSTNGARFCSCGGTRADHYRVKP